MTPYEIIAKSKTDLENKIFYAIDEFRRETGAEVSEIEIQMVNVSTVEVRKYITNKITVKIDL